MHPIVVIASSTSSEYAKWITLLLSSMLACLVFCRFVIAATCSSQSIHTLVYMNAFIWTRAARECHYHYCRFYFSQTQMFSSQISQQRSPMLTAETCSAFFLLKFCVWISANYHFNFSILTLVFVCFISYSNSEFNFHTARERFTNVNGIFNIWNTNYVHLRNITQHQR